ncbi:N-methyl-L-tryptophan oxidase [Microbacterium aurugineum]|uniref:N-methyl-L-tryptophan oxidase n=1 Tax=Microbacterium aurugineum TaxID=2851642 RepID=UPI0020BE2B0B|nr:N-methyl-L-tryptophan oxidase [Microbacterium aurugineum]MCK8475847.1 N-methyl-L-tryptophan oxidase [Microbacterium aurugineum]
MYDIAVVGLGAVGSGTLLAATERGLSAIGIEQYELGHDRGSSHGLSRVFRGAASEGQIYTDLALRSLEIWRDLERRSGEEIVTLTSGIIIAPPDSDLILESRAVLDGHAMPYEELDADEICARYPQHHVRDEDIAILDPSLGVVRPERAILAALAAARERGASVLSRTRVTAIRSIAGGAKVVLDDAETIRARTVVIAAGPWASRLGLELPVSLVTRRALLSWFHPVPGAEDEFAASRFPAFRRKLDSEYGWGAGVIDDHGVKVGLRQQDGYVVDDPSRNPTEVDAWEVERVEAFVAQQFPRLVPKARHATGCMITLTPDERFVIDRVADAPNVLLAAACSGHGFKTSAAVGEVAVQLALDESGAIPASAFSAARFA